MANAVLKATHKLEAEELDQRLSQSNNKLSELNQLSLSNSLTQLLSPLYDIEETSSETDSVLACDSSMLVTPKLAALNSSQQSYMKKLRRIQPTLNRKKKNLKTIYKSLNTKNTKEKPISSLLSSPSIIVTSKPPLPASVPVSCFRSNKEILDTFALNMHRIDKDVARCDRNHWYFTNSNLKKLQNIIYT